MGEKHGDPKEDYIRDGAGMMWSEEISTTSSIMKGRRVVNTHQCRILMLCGTACIEEEMGKGCKEVCWRRCCCCCYCYCWGNGKMKKEKT